MATYLVIRDGKVKLRLTDARIVDGKVTAPTKRGRGYVVDGHLADRDGVLDEVKALAKDCRYDEIDPKYLAGPGTSDSGLVVIEEAEWTAQQRAESDRRRAALIEAVPGLDVLQSALADQDRYHRDFNRMMDDEYNDGVSPPRQPAGDVDALRKQYPRAAAYLKADGWECSSHHAKSGFGRRAKARLVAGEDVEAVLAGMERAWSEWCDKHVD